jgi:hypothetical protein
VSENDESGETKTVAQIRIVAVDADQIREATSLRLEIEGSAELILSLAELNVQALESAGMLFGDPTDETGTALLPTLIDPLAGDSPES